MFPSLTVSGSAAAALLLAALLIPPSADAACRNIVALSSDGEYMVLDPGTLAVLRVGDLHWLGIHGVAPKTGSSVERALLASSNLLPVDAAPPERFVDRRFDPPTGQTMLYLENLGEGIRSQNEIPAKMYPPDERYAFQWTDWIRENTFIREVYNRDQLAIGGYELLDTDFNVLRRWRPQVGFDLQFPSCALGDRVYFAGTRGVHVFDNQGGEMFELESLRNEGLRLVTPHTKNCRALAFRDTPNDNPMFGAVVVDIVRDTTGPEFEVRKFSEFSLYDDGRRLLQQEVAGYRRDSMGRLDATRATPTNQFSLIDTTTGEVLLERELETGSGELSREMLCDAETPRALVKDDDAFYLIDPNTLEIVAGRSVPAAWRVYYVFE